VPPQNESTYAMNARRRSRRFLVHGRDDLISLDARTSSNWTKICQCAFVPNVDVPLETVQQITVAFVARDPEQTPRRLARSARARLRPSETR